MTKEHQDSKQEAYSIDKFDSINIDWIENDTQLGPLEQYQNQQKAVTAQPARSNQPLSNNAGSAFSVYTRRPVTSSIDEHNPILWDDVDGVMIGQKPMADTSVASVPAIDSSQTYDTFVNSKVRYNATAKIKNALDDAGIVGLYGINTREWSSKSKFSPEFTQQYNDVINREASRTRAAPDELRQQYEISRRYVRQIYRLAQKITSSKSDYEIQEQARNDTNRVAERQNDPNISPVLIVAANELIDRMVVKNQSASQTNTQPAAYVATATEIDDDATIKTDNTQNRKPLDAAQQQVTMNFYGDNNNIYVQNSAATTKRDRGTSTEEKPAINKNDMRVSSLPVLQKPQTSGEKDDSQYVLFGRGGRVNDNPANVRFRDSLDKYAEKYLTAKKSPKRTVLYQALQEMLDGGQIAGFKKETTLGNKEWKELNLTDKKDLSLIYNKAGQFLRDKYPASGKRKTTIDTFHVEQATQQRTDSTETSRKREREEQKPTASFAQQVRQSANSKASAKNESGSEYAPSDDSGSHSSEESFAQKYSNKKGRTRF
ncbi:MAG: hypothetical protein PQ612_05015 [Rickettsiales bacterium]|nr:hypothetical protein [Pseudomonadota bacterium]MDA0966380.1 hypothetical protein [Pseudomonadota bacterium]MDG4544013.1 hypothetical protein [Rickettsiales bacterium]MDG4545507.1 hypothetical protein [Rickettsiales bacterium]MDG4547956.1 hypothetical protein [Rickettsiales bacterium]